MLYKDKYSCMGIMFVWHPLNPNVFFLLMKPFGNVLFIVLSQTLVLFQTCIEVFILCLQIKYPQHRDSGIYECQISTTPHMSHFVHLGVVGKQNNLFLWKRTRCTPVACRRWIWIQNFRLDLQNSGMNLFLDFYFSSIYLFLFLSCPRFISLTLPQISIFVILI